MKRTDSHLPSKIDPADYKFVGYSDTAPIDDYAVGYEDDGFVVGQGGHITQWVKDFDRNAFEGPVNPIHPEGCDSCGAHLRYRTFWLCHSTGELIVLGEDCANNMDLGTWDVRKAKKALKAFEEKAAAARKVTEFFNASEENAEAVTFLDEFDASPNYNGFLSDVRFKLYRYGSLSERQVAAVLKCKVREAGREEEEAKRAAEREQADPVPVTDKRIKVTGTVLSTKVHEGLYGVTFKMLVKADEGFKVFGTCPDSLFDENQMMPEQGVRVEFMARVEPSNDDEKFGFFSRPTKAERVVV